MAKQDDQSPKGQQPFFPPLSSAKRAIPVSSSTLKGNTRLTITTGINQSFRPTFVGKCDDYVCSAVFASDGKKVASASLDKTVRVWNIETGLMDMLGSCDDAVWSVAFSPDGKYVASGSADCKIRIWEIKTGRALELVKRGGSIMFVRFSSNGKHLYSHDSQGTFSVCDAKSGRVRHETKLLPNALSSDGSKAVAAMLEGICVCDTKTGQIRAQEQYLAGVIKCAAFSPDSNSIAFGTMDLQAPPGKCHDFKTNPGAIGIWDIRMARINILGNCDRMARCVAFSPDAATIVSGSSDFTVRIWDVHSGQGFILAKCDGEVCSVSFSKDGKGIVASSLDKTVRVWRA